MNRKGQEKADGQVHVMYGRPSPDHNLQAEQTGSRWSTYPGRWLMQRRDELNPSMAGTAHRRGGAFHAGAVALLVAGPAMLAAIILPQDPPTQAVPREGCVTDTCHVDVKNMSFVHGPVNVDACDACHELINAEEHTYRLAREQQELCLFCHELPVAEEGINVHKPLMTGECLECHHPHGGEERSLLKATSAAELCSKCHDDVTGGKDVLHGPVAAGACNACHAPHTSPYPFLLAAQGRDVCLQCHVTTQTQIESSRVIHGPVNVDCQVCHEPHAGDHAMMLREDPPTLCFGCHETIQHVVDSATTQHAAVTTERACLNCHDGHASDYPMILRGDMMTLCFECHDKEITLDNGRKLGNLQKVIAGGTSLHGPVAQSNCAACHEIHGGGNFRLLIKEYPPEFYAPFKEESYALCFSCHDKQLVHDPETTSLTNFRNGNTNLHFLHVNKDRKGRTCRACHETHASKRDRHIRESVPFGPKGWELPINFEKSESGGSCAPGCHAKYAYDRIEQVPYEHEGRKAIWPSEEQNQPDGTPPPATDDEPPGEAADTADDGAGEG